MATKRAPAPMTTVTTVAEFHGEDWSVMLVLGCGGIVVTIVLAAVWLEILRRLEIVATVARRRRT
jgi:hypothetical protein